MPHWQTRLPLSHHRYISRTLNTSLRVPRARQKNAAERKAFLLAEPLIGKVRPEYVWCIPCGAIKRLAKGRSYALDCWLRHRRRQHRDHGQRLNDSGQGQASLDRAYTKDEPERSGDESTSESVSGSVYTPQTEDRIKPGSAADRDSGRRSPSFEVQRRKSTRHGSSINSDKLSESTQ